MWLRLDLKEKSDLRLCCLLRSACYNILDFYRIIKVVIFVCQSLFGPGDDHQLIPGETVIESVEKNAEQLVLPNVPG